jgi:hypothetical protein
MGWKVMHMQSHGCDNVLLSDSTSSNYELHLYVSEAAVKLAIQSPSVSGTWLTPSCTL